MKRFFPDLFAIEALVALAMLVVLIVLSAVTTASLEDTASRDAAGYAPRPEWYFLWLFQLLKYFKGSLEPVGTVLVPLLAVAILLAVPFIDRRPPKTRSLFGRTRPIRPIPRVIAVVAVTLMLALTVVAAISASRGNAPTPAPAPVPEWPPQSQVHDRGRPASASQSMDLSTTRRGSDVRVA